MVKRELNWDAIDATSPVAFEHPSGPDVRLSLEAVATLIRRSLNCVDVRLIDHGLRVASVFDAMLEVSGACDARRRRALYLVALLHDIGAYRTEEIDRLVMFETNEVWEHSFYGYLFLKELSPLAGYADVVLYHHMPARGFTDQDETVRFLAQCLHVADRVDVLLIDRPELGSAEISQALTKGCPRLFSPEVVELFLEAERRFGLVEGLHTGVTLRNPLHCGGDVAEVGTAASCLHMLVHVIDFRSRHTVTHTVTTAWVAYELARRLLHDDEQAERVYLSALLHDLGKIGIPLTILEKPGRLDTDEMTIMRTHVTLTEDIIFDCVDSDIVNMAVRHHEKLDGSGYPRGLPSSDLSLPERIVAVADIVSALVGTRSYKDAFPKEKVLELLVAQSEAGLIDGAVVNEMIRSYDDIMAQVAQASRPVAEAYRRVHEQYLWLLDELDGARRALSADAKAAR